MAYKFKYKVVIFVTVSMVVTSLAFTVLTIFERPRIAYTNSPFPISEQRTYKPSDEIRFIITRCAKRSVHYTLVRTFVSDKDNLRVIGTSDEQAISVKGCATVLGLPVVVPTVLPSGSWHVEHTIAVKGVFRDFVQTIQSTSFMIDNPNPTPIIIPEVRPYQP